MPPPTAPGFPARFPPPSAPAGSRRSAPGFRWRLLGGAAAAPATRPRGRRRTPAPQNQGTRLGLFERDDRAVHRVAPALRPRNAKAFTRVPSATRTAHPVRSAFPSPLRPASSSRPCRPAGPAPGRAATIRRGHLPRSSGTASRSRRLQASVLVCFGVLFAAGAGDGGGSVTLSCRSQSWLIAFKRAVAGNPAARRAVTN